VNKYKPDGFIFFSFLPCIMAEPTWTHNDAPGQFPIDLNHRVYSDYSTATTLNYVTMSQLTQQLATLHGRPEGPHNQVAGYAGFKPRAPTPAVECTQWQPLASLSPAAPRPEWGTKRMAAYGA